MNKLLSLGMMGCLWVGIVNLVLAQDGTGSTYNPLELRQKDSRNQKGPTHRYVHSILPLKADSKNQGKEKPPAHFFSLAPKATPNATPPPITTPLPDQKAKPVTFWPAGQKKNYPTLYQDKQN